VQRTIMHAPYWGLVDSTLGIRKTAVAHFAG
jgi:hypothetical protein